MQTKKMIGLLGLALTMTSSIFAQNLIENSSFENGIAEWKSATWKRTDGRDWLIPARDKTTAQGHSGIYSMRLDYTSKKICHLVYRKNITLPKDMKEFTISFWAKSAGYSDPTKGQVFVHAIFPESKKRMGITTPWNKLQVKWTYFQQDYKVPAGATKVQLLIGIHGYKNPKGTHWLDNIYFGPKKAKETNVAKKKEITILRGVPRAKHNGIWYPGEKMPYDIEVKDVKNPGSKAILKWRIEDFDRVVIASGQQNVTLPANPVIPKKKPYNYKEPRAKIPFFVPDLKNFRGWFAIKAELIQNGRALDTLLSSGVVVEKAPAKRDPFFNAKDAGSVERQTRMGNGSRYVQFERGGFQETATTFNKRKMQSMDRNIAACIRDGFEPIACFQITQNRNIKYPRQPRHIRAKIDGLKAQGKNPYDKEYYDGYEDYFRMIIKRYGKHITDWTVGDEIYHTYHRDRLELEHYIEVTKRLSKAVKEADPNDFVAGAGCFMDKSPIGKVIWGKVGKYLDGLSCSLYIEPGTVAEGMPLTGLEDGRLKERFAHTRKYIGNKAVVGTESGYVFLNHPPIDSDMVKKVAINNARNLVMLKYLGVRSWTYFTFHNDNMYESARYGYGKTDYGMWNVKTGCPKPHAASWAVSARMLAFVKNPIEFKPNSDTYCYVFQKGNKTMTAVWAMTIDPINVEINMPADWKVTDFIGKTWSGKKGLQKFKLNNRVLYFEMDASQKAVGNAFMKGRYVMPEIYMTMNRKSGSEMNVFIKNKLNKPIKANVQFNNQKKNVTVKALELKPVAFPCKMENKDLTAFAIVNGVRYEAKKKDETHLIYRLNKAPVMDGTLRGFKSVKPFLLKSRDFVKPAGDAENHGFWTGLKDLSAKVYLAYDNKYFYIAAEVEDDVQISRNCDVNIWNQDCLQFAFDMANNAYDDVLCIPGYTTDDWEYCIALGTKGPQLYCYTSKGETANKLCADKPVIKRTKDGRTIYEARVPWSGLGNFKPAKGKVIGFNLVIFDIDQKVGAITYRMEISRGIANEKNPIQFKRFVLE